MNLLYDHIEYLTWWLLFIIAYIFITLNYVCRILYDTIDICKYNQVDITLSHMSVCL